MSGLSPGSDDRMRGRGGHVVLKLLAVLMAAGLVLGAFGLGMWVGRLLTADPAAVAQSARPILVSGNIYGLAQDGSEQPDNGAVVLILPGDRYPDEKLAIEGIAPTDPLPPGDHPSLIGIGLLGGAYARTDGGGHFQATLPNPGNYVVLVVSAHHQRPDRREPKVADLAEIGRYFNTAYKLLGPFQYRWESRQLAAGDEINVAFASRPE